MDGGFIQIFEGFLKSNSAKTAVKNWWEGGVALPVPH